MEKPVMRTTDIKIPYETYQRLIDHLSIHSETDGWAKELLSELQELKNSQQEESNELFWTLDPNYQN